MKSKKIPHFQQELKDIYSDPRHPAGFGSLAQLYRAIKARGEKKVTKRQIKEWLETQDAYTFHKRVVRNFPRRKTLSKGIDYQWQADLVVMIAIKKENKNFMYILTVIDVFSRYAWAVPIKTKGSENVLKAFESILIKDERMPQKLQTDKGTEFLNKNFLGFLQKNKIHHFTTDQDPKASLVERFNRTLKERMFEFFSYFSTLNYVRVLPDLMESYNDRIHSVIKMAPSEVNKKNESRVFETQYGKYLRKKRKLFKFKYKDAVRIPKAKDPFTKGYKRGWTREVFFIADRLDTYPATYVLMDRDRNIISGSFYEQELNKVRLTE